MFSSLVSFLVRRIYCYFKQFIFNSVVRDWMLDRIMLQNYLFSFLVNKEQKQLEDLVVGSLGYCQIFL